jgi:hypothetical protein
MVLVGGFLFTESNACSVEQSVHVISNSSWSAGNVYNVARRGKGTTVSPMVKELCDLLRSGENVTTAACKQGNVAFQELLCVLATTGVLMRSTSTQEYLPACFMDVYRAILNLLAEESGGEVWECRGVCISHMMCLRKCGEVTAALRHEIHDLAVFESSYDSVSLGKLVANGVMEQCPFIMDDIPSSCKCGSARTTHYKSVGFTGSGLLCVELTQVACSDYISNKLYTCTVL